MDESLKEQAFTMLRDLIGNATRTGDFISEQVPLVIQELIRLYTIGYTVALVAGVSVLVVLPFWIRFLLRKASESSYDDSYEAAIAGSTLVGFIALVLSVWAFIGLIQITLAPRVWLIEYAAGLMK